MYSMFDFLKRRKKEPIAPTAGAGMPPVPEPPRFKREPLGMPPVPDNLSPDAFSGEEAGFSQAQTPEEPPAFTSEEPEFEKKLPEGLLHDVELPSPPEELPGADFVAREPRMDAQDIRLFKPATILPEAPAEEPKTVEMLEPSEHFMFEEPEQEPEATAEEKPETKEHEEPTWQEVKWDAEPEHKEELLEAPAEESEEPQAEEPMEMHEESAEESEETQEEHEEPEMPLPVPPKPKKQPIKRPEPVNEEDYELPDFDESIEIFQPAAMPAEEPVEIPKPAMAEVELEEMAPQDIFVSTNDFQVIVKHFQDLTKTLGKSYAGLGSIVRINDEQKSHFESLFSHINQAQDSLISIDKKLFEKR